MNMFSRGISLKSALIALYAIVTISVALAGYLSYSSSRQSIGNVALQLRTEITDRIETHLLEFLHLPHRINQANAQALTRQLIAANDQLTLGKRFAEQIGMFPSVSSVYFGNIHGGLVNSGRESPGDLRYLIDTEGFTAGTFRKTLVDAQGNHAEQLAVLSNFDSRNRPWYVRALERNGPVWSDVYILFTGKELALAASLPAYDGQGGLLGVVSVDVFLSNISHFLQGMRIGETGQAFILDRDGLLIATSTTELLIIDSGDPAARSRVHGTESSDPVVRNASATLASRFGNFSEVEKETSLTFTVNGRQMLLQTAPLRDDLGIDWLILVVVPEDDFMAAIMADSRMIHLHVTFALALVLAAGVFLTKWIVKPVSLLNMAADRVAAGESIKKIEDYSPVIEFRGLTRSFNRMAHQLSNTLEGLELELRERKRAEEELRRTREQFELAVLGSNDGIWDWNLRDNSLFLSPRWKEQLGYEDKELSSEFNVFYSRLHPEDVPRLDDYLKRYLKGEVEMFEIEFRMLHREGGYRWILSRGTAFRDEKNLPFRMAGSHTDITDRKAAEQALKEKSEELERYFTTSLDLLCIANTKGEFIRLNPEWEKVLGYSLTELEGRNFFDFVHPDDMEDTVAAVSRLDAQEQVLNFENRYRRKDGSYSWIEWRAFPRNGTIYAVARDITRRKADEEKLNRLATTDSLTGLCNRRAFMQTLETELGRYRRYGKHASLLMLDLDHFKTINDTHGHAGGDEVLRYFAMLLQETVRETDLPGRLGGEEFAVLLPETKVSSALVIAERLLRKVRETVVWTHAGTASFTVSIGLGVMQPEDSTPDSLLARADAALYRAKDNGRDRVEVYSLGQHDK
ncbi:PAS domain S-box-containing protein/diguanylate cyclase (GGDEF) domain-containing protein [Desulfonatronum thiosulfatophilum]|uniref:PAS domain S-box-containing protein/diguanylate cyclase (GGDEF) domain-containing protein n=1 Tax=Desulfonatronum thiosulfatophilum TaxID=617002 RepID=A0A1G6CH10_9BACT|nr:diguanylate cyclase [Desulfonatronum thiosulfatophilum]SDB32111.1 PAS domain S-box-containing protein/diguanylate cyclase (GGDEF) domain-containing protein [Desulfonatronum thiosulfatophilum]